MNIEQATRPLSVVFRKKMADADDDGAAKLDIQDLKLCTACEEADVKVADSFHEAESTEKAPPTT
jgi:hypothetical protein